MRIARAATLAVAAVLPAGVGLVMAGAPAYAYSYRYCAFAYYSGGYYTDSVNCYSDAGYSVKASVPQVYDIYDSANQPTSENMLNDQSLQNWSSKAITSSGGVGVTVFYTPGFALGTPTGHNVQCPDYGGAGMSGHKCTWTNP